MTVKIICDSSADLNLPKDKTLYEKYDVQWVPMQVMFGTEAYKELQDIKTSEFYKKLTKTEVHPTTSQSTQADLLAAYEKYSDKADEIISMHLSGELSGAVANARMAKKMYDRQKKKGANIHVYDTRFASSPFGVTVLKATKLAQEGLSAEEIMSKLDEWRINDLSFYFTVSDLKWLYEGGRLSRAKYKLGSWLKKKPILTFVDGKIVPSASVKGLDKAVDTIVEKQLEDLQAKPEEVTIHFGHAEFYDEVKVYAKKIQDKYPGIKIGEIFTIGAAIGSHTGPGTIVMTMTRDFEY
jgi:DegV family protein with EDD domain